MVIGFCVGVCSGFAIPIAQSFGAGDHSGLRRYTANSLWLCIGFSAVLTAIVSVYCRPILELLRTPADIIDYANTYIFIIFLGIPFTFLYNMLAGILRSMGDSRTPVVFLAVSSCLNIGLDMAFILLLGMGVDGTALATVISQAVSAVICFVYMRRRYEILKMQPGEIRPSGRHMARLCYMGVPMGAQYSVTAIGSLIVQSAMNSFGSSVVAGSTAAMRIHGFVACPIEALGASMAPYTGQNMGAGKYDRIQSGTMAASLMGFVVSAGIVVFTRLFGRLVMLFLDVPDEAVIGYAVQFLNITASCYCLLTLVNVVRFSIQGMGFSVLAVAAGAMELLARAIAGLGLAPRFGYIGVCFAHPLAWLFADLFLIPAFFLCLRKVRSRGISA